MTEMYRLARPLLKGVKCEILSGQPSEHIKNRMIRDMLTGLPQFRGEIIVGNPVGPYCHERSLDLIEDERLMDLYVFWVYDLRTTELYDLKKRLELAKWLVETCGPVVQYVDHELITSGEELQSYVTKVVRDNYFPGIVLREPYGTFGTQDEEIPKESLKLQ